MPPGEVSGFSHPRASRRRGCQRGTGEHGPAPARDDRLPPAEPGDGAGRAGGVRDPLRDPARAPADRRDVRRGAEPGQPDRVGDHGRARAGRAPDGCPGGPDRARAGDARRPPPRGRADRTRRGGADVPGAGRAAGGDRCGAGRSGGRRDGARRRGGRAAWARLRDGPLRGRQLPGRGRRPGPRLAGRRRHLVAMGCRRGRGRGTARDRGVLVAAARARGRRRGRAAGRREAARTGRCSVGPRCWRCCSCR